MCEGVRRLKDTAGQALGLAPELALGYVLLNHILWNCKRKNVQEQVWLTPLALALSPVFTSKQVWERG